jgi:hypothetical protein
MVKEPEAKPESRLSLGSLEYLNQASITPDDMKSVVAEGERLHEEGIAHDGEGMWTIARMFRGEPQKAAAIWFRMVGLSKVLEEQKTPGWTLSKGEDGCILTKEELIEAVAICPLVEVSCNIGFDLKTLLDKALELANPEGRC